MFPIPTGEDTACVVGIDPGTIFLGLSCIEFNVDTFEVVKVTAETVDGSKLPSNPWLGRLYGGRAQRIDALGNFLTTYLHHNDPFGIACEAPFFNPRRPNAYAALIEVVCALKQSLWVYDRRKKLYSFDPPTVKKAVGASGGGGKDVVKDAIRKHAVLGVVMKDMLDTLDEHSIDATAVAFTLLNEYSSGKVQPLLDPT